MSETQWRREAIFGNNHFVRTRNGEKYYLQAEGPATGFLRLVLMMLEPIPAIDTFVESDWRIQRDQWNGISTVRVASGHENPDGSPDPKMFRGYWFDSGGQLVKAYQAGLEIRRSNFKEFGGALVAERIDVLKDNQLAMQITVTSVNTTQPSDPKLFVLRGHEWERRFTAEVR